MSQLLHSNSNKGLAKEHELPAVKELPPWFKESFGDAEEVRNPTCPVHTGRHPALICWASVHLQPDSATAVVLL